jgi:ATP-binding cassette subfamily F protein 3
VIAISNLSKSYATQTLFEDASFFINPKERIGLVGRNGHGKSTLFRILAGLETADSGEIRFPKGYRLGYLSQHLDFTQQTVLQEACLGLPPGQELEQWKAEKILMGLGFERPDFDRHPDEFSGGYQLRINLTKALVNEPDLILLDEPTNFLDIVSIRWMIKFLRAWPGELMLISHDRSFMDAVVTHIVGIHRHGVKKIEGDTGDYYEQIAVEETFYEQERLNLDKKRQKTEAFVNRFRAKATKAKQVQSRVKMLDKMGTKAKLSKIADLDFAFHALPFPAKYLLQAHNLAFGYDPARPLFDKLSFTVEKHDRICIIGKNGRGKTTLLKLLAGELMPQSGNLKPHPLLVKGYFEQANTAQLNSANTVEMEIQQSLEKQSLRDARRIAGLMMFSGDAAQKKIGVLSGGEKARVLLGKLLAAPAHLILLDEPTHHLDMQSSEAMADAVTDFDGAAIVVTHDENFLRAVATKLIVFHRDEAFVFYGSYDDFLREVGWGDDAEIKTAPTPPHAAKTDRRERAEQRAARNRVLKPLENKIKHLEREITRQEKEYAEQTEAMVTAASKNHAADIARLSKSLHDLRQKIDFAYLELETLSDEYETAKATQDSRHN